MSNLGDILRQVVCTPKHIPDDWQFYKLTDICNPKQWKTISATEMTKSGYPVFGANGFVGFYHEYNHEHEAVAITCRGNTCGTINRIPPRTYITGNSMALDDIKKNVITQDYLYYALKYRGVGDSISGSAQPQITGAGLRSIEFPAPPLPEQQKIATILSSVDDVIEKTRAQINKLKDLKTGMMQELLTKGIGHTEFKDSPVGRIPAAWDVVHLESLVSIMESGWSPQCESVPAKGCEWAVLKTTAVSWDGFDFRANKKLPDELEPRPKIQVEVHDILITRAGPAERVGVVSYVAHVPKRIMLSDKLIRIKAHHNQNPQFLSFWLSTEFVKNYFSQRTTGLAQSQTNISQDILKSLLCVVPPLAEQEMISSTIDALEKQLITKRNILSHYEKTKKALMQDLLTGKVRVNITDKESAVV